jgi:hypothetical protein
VSVAAPLNGSEGSVCLLRLWSRTASVEVQGLVQFMLTLMQPDNVQPANIVFLCVLL